MSLDEAFDLLKQAENLESRAKSQEFIDREGNDPPWKTLEDSANKYYEACHLMKNYARSNSHSMNAETKRLLTEKVDHYEQFADSLRAEAKEWKCKRDSTVSSAQEVLSNESVDSAETSEFDDHENPTMSLMEEAFGLIDQAESPEQNDDDSLNLQQKLSLNDRKMPRKVLSEQWNKYRQLMKTNVRKRPHNFVAKVKTTLGGIKRPTWEPLFNSLQSKDQPQPWSINQNSTMTPSESKKSLIDEAFKLLFEAKNLELNAESVSRLKSYGGEPPWILLEKSANKYIEACTLLKRFLSSQPTTDSATVDDDVKTRTLLVGKISQYQDLSDMLMRNAKASQVSNKASLDFQTAIECDEQGDVSKAELHYTKAVEGYSDAVKILTNTTPEGALSQGISQMKIQSTLPRSRRSASNKEMESSLTRKITVILERVEKLKKGKAPLSHISVNTVKQNITEVNDVHASRKASPKNAPREDRQSLTKYEISVLMRSSTIASGLFLPWDDEEARNYDYFDTLSHHQRSTSAPPLATSTCRINPAPQSAKIWEDPDGLLKLSEKQKKRFFKWARPSQIAAMRSSTDNTTSIAMIKSITPYTIKQYCVSDCSFIAGLIIAAAKNHRLITSLIFPQDVTTGMPVYNPRGIYMVKLWLNGVARRVMVDDRLPIDEHGNLLCSHTISVDNRNMIRAGKVNNVLELWVSILEKAYMKLCGGYDFPGSNSGVDLFSLTGWIPEKIFFPENPSSIKDFETPTERAWERLHSANSYGDCLITVSTSRELTEAEAERVGLYTAHAYAVLDVVQTSTGTRLLQLKNPWATKRWKGDIALQDKHIWDDPVLSEKKGTSSFQASTHDDGVFWISWDDVLRYFRNLHLSWNPDLFDWSLTFHGSWDDKDGPVDDSLNVGENPQFILTLSDKAVDNKSSLWILLSRHVTKQEQEGAECNDFLTLLVHRVKRPQQRVWYPGGCDCVVKNAYTNNQHVLVRYDVTGPQDKYLSIVLSKYSKSKDLGYTLKCYCTNKFKLVQPEQQLPLYKELKGSWELRDDSDTKYSLKIGTAGGPPGKGSFGSNPQWSMVVSSKTKLQLKCMAAESLAIAVVVVKMRSNSSSKNQNLMDEQPQQSKRVHHLYYPPIIDSGDYRYGFAVTDPFNIPPGLYTIIVSTYQLGQVGKFHLHVHSTTKDIAITEIP